MPEEGSTRVPFIKSKEEIPEDQHENYDLIVDPRGSTAGPFGVLLHSPELAGRFGHLGSFLRFEGVLTGDVRELAILTTVREFDCAFEWAAHEPLARDEGVSDETIDAVATHAPIDDLPEDEALIVQFGREIFRENEISEGTFQAARDRFGDTGVVELTATMGYYGLCACVLNTFEVLPDDNTPWTR